MEGGSVLSLATEDVDMPGMVEALGTGWSKIKGKLGDIIDTFAPLSLEDVPSYNSTVV